MAEIVRIAAPRPSPIPLFFSTICIGAVGLLLPSPEGLDPASIAYLLSSLLAFKVGLVLIYVAVSGAPLRPVYVQLLTKVAIAASVAALLLAPPPGRLHRDGTPAPVHDPGRPKPLFTYDLPPVGSPEVAQNTVVGHLESFIASDVSTGSLVVAVPDRVAGSAMPSFVHDALIGKTKATEDLLAVCAVPPLTNIAPLPLFCEIGNRGEVVKEVI